MTYMDKFLNATISLKVYHKASVNPDKSNGIKNS